MPVNYLYWIFICNLASYIPHTNWRFSNAHNFVKNLVWHSFYLLIGQDFNMSHRCDRLGSLLPRWTSGYGINLIILFFLDQVARVGQWTTRLPYLKIRTSRYGMSRSLVSILGILGRHVTPLWHVVSMKNYGNFAVSGTFWKYLVHDGSKLVAFKVAPRPELRPAIMYCELVKRRSYFWVNFSSFCT